jgi:hypothetical protein
MLETMWAARSELWPIRLPNDVLCELADLIVRQWRGRFCTVLFEQSRQDGVAAQPAKFQGTTCAVQGVVARSLSDLDRSCRSGRTVARPRQVRKNFVKLVKPVAARGLPDLDSHEPGRCVFEVPAARDTKASGRFGSGRIGAEAMSQTAQDAIEGTGVLLHRDNLPKKPIGMQSIAGSHYDAGRKREICKTCPGVSFRDRLEVKIRGEGP